MFTETGESTAFKNGSSEAMHVHQAKRESSSMAPLLIKHDASYGARAISATATPNSSVDIPISGGSAIVPIITTTASNFSGTDDPRPQFLVSNPASVAADHMPTTSTTGILSFSTTAGHNVASAVSGAGFPNFMPTANVAAGGAASTVAFTGGGLVKSAMKKKRGRPRKYGPTGGATTALDITCSNIALTVTPIMSSSPIMKRGRGRPPGTGKNQQLAALGELMSGSAGMGFAPHSITVATGEDIASRIMSFSQQGPRAICILSANGAISSATLRQPSTAGGAVTYEGRFEILSLSGSFLVTQSAGGRRSRAGGLSMSLAGPDGRVFGGAVSGALIAASPVQIIVGSFVSNPKRLQPKVHMMKVEGLVAHNNEEELSTMKFVGEESPVRNLDERTPLTSSNTDSPGD